MPLLSSTGLLEQRTIIFQTAKPKGVERNGEKSCVGVMLRGRVAKSHSNSPIPCIWKSLRHHFCSPRSQLEMLSSPLCTNIPSLPAQGSDLPHIQVSLPLLTPAPNPFPPKSSLFLQAHAYPYWSTCCKVLLMSYTTDWIWPLKPRLKTASPANTSLHNL